MRAALRLPHPLRHPHLRLKLWFWRLQAARLGVPSWEPAQCLGWGQAGPCGSLWPLCRTESWLAGLLLSPPWPPPRRHLPGSVTRGQTQPEPGNEAPLSAPPTRGGGPCRRRLIWYVPIPPEDWGRGQQRAWPGAEADPPENKVGALPPKGRSPRCLHRAGPASARGGASRGPPAAPCPSSQPSPASPQDGTAGPGQPRPPDPAEPQAPFSGPITAHIPASPGDPARSPSQPGCGCERSACQPPGPFPRRRHGQTRVHPDRQGSLWRPEHTDLGQGLPHAAPPPGGKAPRRGSRPAHLEQVSQLGRAGGQASRPTGFVDTLTRTPALAWTPPEPRSSRGWGTCGGWGGGGMPFPCWRRPHREKAAPRRPPSPAASLSPGRRVSRASAEPHPWCGGKAGLDPRGPPQRDT